MTTGSLFLGWNGLAKGDRGGFGGGMGEGGSLDIGVDSLNSGRLTHREFASTSITVSRCESAGAGLARRGGEERSFDFQDLDRFDALECLKLWLCSLPFLFFHSVVSFLSCFFLHRSSRVMQFPMSLAFS